MQQQQQKEEPFNQKQSFEIGMAFLWGVALAVTVPFRRRCGVEAFGKPAFLGFVVMCLWAAFSKDLYMWCYVGLWLFCLARNRAEAVRLQKQGVIIHSQYEGDSEFRRSFKSERLSKQVVEPAAILATGIALHLFYRDVLYAGVIDYPQSGLPAFLMVGAGAAAALAGVRETISKRKTQAMIDARIEQENTMRNVRDRFGDH
jgi:hypothetical protein